MKKFVFLVLVLVLVGVSQARAWPTFTCRLAPNPSCCQSCNFEQCQALQICDMLPDFVHQDCEHGLDAQRSACYSKCWWTTCSIFDE